MCSTLSKARDVQVLECSNLILPLNRVCDDVFFLPCIDIFHSEVVDAVKVCCIIPVSKAFPIIQELLHLQKLRKRGVCTPGVMLTVTLAAGTLA